MAVFTIGYEGLDINRFLSLLDQYGVDTVVDIRELPLSRKPGFSKASLAKALHEIGLAYVHMADLGCPKSVRNRYREDKNWTLYSQGFLAHLGSQTAAIAKLCEMAQSSNCALLCFEADFRLCHRSMVAQAVCHARAVTVEHIDTLGSRTKTVDPVQAALA